MYEILTLNKIAACGLEQLPADKYTITDDAQANADGIILRSFAMHDMELPANLKAVARAGAGTNNIPTDKCAEKGIVVFNTPGANANAVKELVLAGLFLASRKISDGIAWANTLTGDDVAKQVEKGKSNFAGQEVQGKTLGVIGLGAIGVLVANAARHLGMNVIGYDPYLSVDAAWRLSSHIQKAKNIDEIYANSDYITVHVPLTPETKNTLNADTFAKMKDGVRILNFSRGELVNNDDIKAALANGKVAAYVVDFPMPDTVNYPGIIAIPHLGASTEESEDNCAIMAAQELSSYLETGNILNSVNFPNCELPLGGEGRICVLHRNIPNMIAQFSTVFSEQGKNIAEMINKSKKDYACTIINSDEKITPELVAKVEA
ncbi:MAG: 3-phosphoglycerate dehydrogenase, partial [Ruminococcaceae bacterium]|nr:3-phosphoglycerate dehydrogenase [Oscillospiraceae bacterium]